MDRSDRTRQMRMLMTLRIVTVTTLLVCAFGIELLLKPAEGEGLRPLFLLAAVAYGMAIVYGLLDRWLHGSTSLLYLQLLGDAVIVTLFVQITGGLDSPMSFLYLLPIAVASLLLYRRGGLAIAGAAWLCYATMIAAGRAWTPLGSLAPIPSDPEPGRVLYLLVSHLVAMLLLAVLASYLSERVAVQGHELAERQQAVARLKALNENIIESINSGLITTDLNGRVNFINRGGSEITGHGQEDLEGRDIADFFGLGDDALSEIRRRLLAHRRYRFERDFATPAGRRSTSASPRPTCTTRPGGRWATSSSSRT